MAEHQQLPRAVTAGEGLPGFAVWLTGPPAAGKTTLALELQRLLALRGLRALILDSDDLRQVLTPHPVYSEAERDWFYAVIAYLASWLTRGGVNVLIAATAHKRVYRERAQAQVQRFAEVLVHCAPETCRQRDPKGLYARAQAGRAPHLPGAGVACEPPLEPLAAVDTGSLSPATAAAVVLAELEKRLLIDDGTTSLSGPLSG